MAEEKSPRQKPLTQAIVLFVVLLIAIILGVFLIDFSKLNTRALLFISAIMCAFFIAKNVYDNAAAEDFSEEVDKNFTENLIYASKELYTELYQNSPVPYLLIDVDGCIKSANLAAHRLLGLTKGKEAAVNVFNQIVSEEEHHIDFLIEKYKNRIPVNGETVQVKSIKGEEAWVLLSLFHFVSAGQPIGLLTLVDITRQKQVESAKSEFVSLASHQLRTPIAGIKWSAELLLLDGAKSLTDQQRKYIDRLLIATNRMALLIDDFLRVSKFELGTFYPEYGDVVLKDLVEEVLSEQSGRIGQKKLEVKTFFDEALPTITSDSNLLRMIVTNLFSNAVKYTRESGTIHIGFGKKDDNIIFSVADNGMGIPESDQERIFGKLFRAGNALRSVPDGTGLGLYIVHEAVKVLHGKVTFHSIENNGTTFEVVIPLR
jgi:PAS domain S-box-containing protein